MKNPEKVQILLVEDDETDIMLFERSWKRQDVKNPLWIARNGEEALALIRGETSEPLARPFIIFLDLNMPRMGGLEFLDEIRNDPDLKDIVIFVLTTSSHESDMRAVYQKNVAGYIIKSNVMNDLASIIGLIQYYCDNVEIP